MTPADASAAPDWSFRADEAARSVTGLFGQRLWLLPGTHIGAIGLHWPISTTHTVTSAVLGAGTNQRYTATNRRLVLRILAFWALTPLVTAAAAFVLELALSPLAGL